MPENQTHKICLIGECLSTGGAEKAMALLSRFFLEKGIETHTVIVIDDVSYDYSGALLNLGKLKNASNGITNKIKRFRTLKKYLRAHQFDYIIDFRVRSSFLQEFFISRLLYNAPTIYTVHSAMTHLYFPKSKWQAKLIYERAFGIAAVSNGIAEIIRNQYDLNAKTIHNPIDIAAIVHLSEPPVEMNSKYILAAGRMDKGGKQFDKLIETYAKSNLPKQNIKFVILGGGKQRKDLKKLAEQLLVKDKIILKGHVQNPYPYMKNALFFVLSSKSEGLPTVILESLACGIPVVSFDCVSGPSEMIIDGENGILVADQDFGKLKEAMNEFVSNADLYQHCKANAKAAITKFSMGNIGQQWLKFLKIDVS